MKQYVKVALILFTICAVAALLLALINSVTAPVIAAAEQQAKKETLGFLAFGNDIGDTRDADDAAVKEVTPLLKDGNIVAYVLEVVGTGYGGEMRLLAAYDVNGKLLGSKMTNSSETPGLGKKAHEDWYMNMFISKDNIPASKNDLPQEEVATVSGATITFNGVAKMLNAGSTYVVTLGGK